MRRNFRVGRVLGVQDHVDAAVRPEQEDILAGFSTFTSSSNAQNKAFSMENHRKKDGKTNLIAEPGG